VWRRRVSHNWLRRRNSWRVASPDNCDSFPYKGLVWHFMDTEGSAVDIRAEIEKRITRGECFSTSVEVPLTDDCKKILNLAVEESDRLGHPHVGTEHVLLGMLLVESSLAAQILAETGIKPQPIREQLGRPLSPMLPKRGLDQAQSG
jgi:ATP-dependent Clp protease ATP-binding subunit ClpC